jgi:hypothetical protein
MPDMRTESIPATAVLVNPEAIALARRVHFYFKQSAHNLAASRSGWESEIRHGRRSEVAFEYLARFKSECVEGFYSEVKSLWLEWCRVIPEDFDQQVLLAAADKPVVSVAGETYPTAFSAYRFTLKRLAEGWSGGFPAWIIDREFPSPGWERTSVESWCDQMLVFCRDGQQLARLEQEFALLTRFMGRAEQPAEGTHSKQTRAKRSTEKGEALAKIIAALTAYHEYDSGHVGNWAPVGLRHLKRLSDTSNGSVSDFFNSEFSGHKEYKIMCHRDRTGLERKLRGFNGDWQDDILYGATPPDEDTSDDEDF